MTAAQATPYDDVRYRSAPNPVANPGKLAAIGRLHGLNPADVARARMLEIGCGDGGHLLGLAALHPDADLVGCDLASTAIADAAARAQSAGLRNVRFHVADVRELPPALGRFDFVIAHGIYSWIPADARDALLAACGDLLADDGIAFVSYNTQPGGHLRQLARDILLFHVADLHDTASRLAEARALARLLTAEGDREDAANAALRFEMRQILERSDQALRHDDLAEHHHAVTFTEFVVHARSHGLSFLAEAEYFTAGDIGLSPGTRAVLASMERLAREQYRDFLGCRRFRQTLLCRASSAVRGEPDTTAVDALYVAAPHAHGQRPAADDSPPAGSLEARVRSLIDAVDAAAPQPLPFRDAGAAFGTDFGEAASVDELRRALLDGLRAGRLHLSTLRSPARLDVTAKPQASRYARLQAAEGDLVVNADLFVVRLDDEAARALYLLLDGTHDAGELVRLLGEAGREDVTLSWVEASLVRFAKLGLLAD